MIRPLYSHLASALQAHKNSIKFGNSEWIINWGDSIESLCQWLPSGSGFDCGTKLDVDASTPLKLVFTTSFHHMDENGCYCGWTEHTVKVTPAFDGIDIAISGRNRNDIKEYMYDTFHQLLTQSLAMQQDRSFRMCERWPHAS